MSDLTICSHCGESRNSLVEVEITTMSNGNNRLVFYCDCGEDDIIQITPAKQEVDASLKFSTEKLSDAYIEELIEAINDVGVRKNTYINTRRD